MMAYTGGPLNELNGKMGISAPFKSVQVMKLIRIHQPKSKEELVELIKFHYQCSCKCGIKSQGTVEDFGNNLYNSQKIYWGEIRYSLKDCIQWEYDLFVVQSLKGGIVEKKAISVLQTTLLDMQFIKADGYVDEELRIDIIVKKENLEIGGIQVKPATFKFMRNGVISFNATANKKWGKPVLYLYYDNNEEFINLKELINELKEL
jgi:hypothetical protein